MTDTPAPVAVVPMTDTELAQRRALIGADGVRANLTVSEARRIFARLDAAESRALPAPRRYTGGPLEDGLYLWRPPSGFAVSPDHWEGLRHGYPDFSSQFVTGQMLRLVQEQAFVWLIGPIPTPDLPDEEAAND